jgi:hypothetical protein
MTMGKRGMRWADLAEYVQHVRGLLRGYMVEIQGEACQLIHSPGFAPSRPITVPLGLAPIAPKSFAISRQIADVAAEAILATVWTGDAASVGARMDAVGATGNHRDRVRAGRSGHFPGAHGVRCCCCRFRGPRLTPSAQTR